MTLTESRFTSADGTELASWAKKANKDSNRAVLVFHGYAEHIGRYRSFITRLSNEGYHVFALEHVGHGNSGGARAMIRSFARLTEDARAWFALLRDQYPDMQWFVFGHSMGGAVALDLAVNDQDYLRGMLLSGPLIVLPSNVPDWIKPVARVIAAVTPSLPLVPLDAEALSRDPGVVRRYTSDPKVYSGSVKAATAAQLDAFASHLQGILQNIKLPFWVGHGSLDRVTDPEGSKKLYQRAASADKKHKVYNGLFHELLNEPESEIVIHDILHWLRKH